MISLEPLGRLLKSKFHEERLFALLVMVEQFARSDDRHRTAIYQMYLKNTRYINNWDLVDCSAPSIVGGYLEGKDKQILYTLAISKSLWERRIAMLAVFYQIRKEALRMRWRLQSSFWRTRKI
jgi:3-methyladenine DNA glycosylase AlkD